ncbi:MAG: AsmA family protein, partial [Hylemonella sp.]
MRRARKYLFWVLAALVLVLAAVLLVVHRWVSTDEFRLRVEQEATAVLGVPLKLERVGLTLWPLPGVALDGVELRTRQPLKVERIELRPAWLHLLIGRVAISTLVVRRAVLPQQGIDALLASLQKIRQRDKSPQTASSLHLLPRRTVLDELSWVDARGKAIVIQAEAQLDSDALPERLALDVVHGRLQGTRLDLRRSEELAWEVLLQVAGGTVQGRVEVQPVGETGAEFLLKGQLQTRDVELSQLT